jgi:hypothetical protein
LRALGDSFVTEFLEFVSDLVRDLERSRPILIRVDRAQTEAALGGLEQQTQTADSVDAGLGRERDDETRAVILTEGGVGDIGSLFTQGRLRKPVAGASGRFLLNRIHEAFSFSVLLARRLGTGYMVAEDAGGPNPEAAAYI